MKEQEPLKRIRVFNKEFVSKYLYIFIVGLILLLGVSYSITFFIQNTSIASGSFVTDSLSISLSNNSINATNLTVPTDDLEGIGEFLKTLEVTNNGTADGNINLTLSRTSGLSFADMRYALSINGVIQKIDDVPNDGTILSSSIFSGETLNIEIRLWPKSTYSGSATTFVGTIDDEISYLGTVASDHSSLNNSYVNFNCSGNTCEVWRIVKVEDDRLVLTREADLSGATSRTNSNRYNPSLTFNDNSMITSVSTDNKNVYLAKTVKINSGEGTQANPYTLINNDYNVEDEKVIAIITYHNDTDTLTQPIYYNKTNYISKEIDDYRFQGWATASGSTTVSYVLGDTITFTTDTDLYAVIKNYLSSKIYNLCNDSSVTYVEKYNTANGDPIDTPDGSGDKDVCFYTSDTSANLAGQNSNVIFGDYCWQIVRTTADGGVKLVYNGEKSLDNKCLTTRSAGTGVVGTTGTQKTTISGSKIYGTGFEIFDDDGTNKFRLLNTNTYSWSDSTYQNIIGKYVCGTSSSPTGDSNTCTVLYYVGHYQSNTEASTEKYTIGSTTYYSQIGTSSYNAYNDSPALVGYMYGDVYNYQNRTNLGAIKYLITSTNMSSTTTYYYGDTATWNPDTNMYDLTIGGATPTATAWSSIYSTAQGMYTCRNTTDTSCATVYYIEGADSNYMYNISLSNNENIDTKTVTWTVSTDFTKNGNDYVLTNPDTLTITLKDWYTNYSNSSYKNIYVCSDFTSSTCSEMYYIYSTGKDYVYFNRSVVSYIFGNNVTYINGEYIIDTNVDTTKYQQIWEWGKNYNTINNSHYTCFKSDTDNCGSSVYYVYRASASHIYYIELKNGKKVEDALKEMLNYKVNSNDIDTNINRHNSAIKGIIDNWYKQNIDDNNLTSYLDSNAVFCNDRSILNLNGWNPTGGDTMSDLQFRLYNAPTKVNASLSCTNIIDRFSKANTGIAELTYPVGLLTEPERAMMQSNYAKTGKEYWLESPGYFDNTSARGSYTSMVGSDIKNSLTLNVGVRPVIVLKPGIEITGGLGTYDAPYIVNTTN